MFAGHGSPRSMELAGKVQDDGSGGVQEVEDKLDLDGNAKPTEDLFLEVLKNMDSTVSATTMEIHRRILFNACLTNSNDVHISKITPGTTKADQKTAIKNSIKNNNNLTLFLQNLAIREKRAITSIGANGSFAQIGLIDSNDNLDLTSTGDPKLTASKLDYVEHGTDANGALNAVVETWANNESACIAAMKNRIAAPKSTKWDNTLIPAAYDIIIKNIGNGVMIKAISMLVSVLSHMEKEVGCKVSAFGGNESVLPSETIQLIKALKGSTSWSSEKFIPLVMYQLWMTADSSNKSLKTDFLYLIKERM